MSRELGIEHLLSAQLGQNMVRHRICMQGSKFCKGKMKPYGSDHETAAAWHICWLWCPGNACAHTALGPQGLGRACPSPPHTCSMQTVPCPEPCAAWQHELLTG